MGRQTIPDQDYFLSADKPLPLFQEHKEGGAVVAARLGAGEQACLGALPAEAQRRRHRCFTPMIAPWLQDRCCAARCPGRSNRRLWAESGFVVKEDPGLWASSVFFTSGQRTFFP